MQKDINTTPCPPKHSLSFVSRNLIDDAGYPFLKTVGEEVCPDLLHSIETFGIIHPLLIQERQNKTYTLLSGLQRLKAAEALLIDLIPCSVLPWDTEPMTSLSMIYLHRNTPGKKKNPIEDALLLQQAMEELTETKAASFYKIMGYSEHQAREVVRLLELEDSVVQALYTGTLAPRSGKKLRKISHEEQKLLNSTITKYGFSASKQNKLIDLCLELCIRNHMTVDEVLNIWQDAPATDEKNKPQQGTQLLNRLQTMATPRLSKANTEFRQYMAQLDLTQGMTITPSPSFEKDELTLNLSFDDKKALENALPDIKKILS